MADREWGYPLCSDGKTIRRGKTVHGDEHSVVVPNNCPAGTRRIGVHHYHPGGSLIPSAQDIDTMRRLRLNFMCIEARKNGRRSVVCFRPKRS
jgi:proteasome lid subunit RPN8/RPN11